MLSRWPIKYKLWLGIALLVVMLVLLASSGLTGVYSYRQLVRQISRRADELPLATNVTSSLDALELSAQEAVEQDFYFRTLYFGDFKLRFLTAKQHVDAYRRQLGDENNVGLIANNREELEVVEEIQQRLRGFELLYGENHNWINDEAQKDHVIGEFQELKKLGHRLPELMQNRMNSLHGEVRVAYRAMIVMSWVTSFCAVLLLCLLCVLFHIWVFRPLQVLINGSRRVAGGEFRHRIRLTSHDEMAELAGAMNDMTARFQEIRDGLDQEVRQRTREVVQSERLASVGFLAAGVAHEINNPLAAIAMSADSLVLRVNRLLDEESEQDAEDRQADIEVVDKYLRRIQEESFRCKGITERLLDFSRLGNMEQDEADLHQLTAGVIEMLQDLGKYRGKNIVFQCAQRVTAWVNAQEIKQVVLNLITNALDSLDADGTVTVQVRQLGDSAQIVVQDNGCGMTEEVCQHLFEPFFTRRRDGTGTGLGLSITYRIVTDHGGRIEAHSDGPGRGSTLRVTLPVRPTDEQEKRVQKAA